MCFKIVVLHLNHTGLIWPTTSESCSTAAGTELSIPTADARIRWANPVLSSWSAATSTQAHMGSACTFSTVPNTPSTARCEDVLGWCTVSKVRMKVLQRLSALDKVVQTAYFLNLDAVLDLNFHWHFKYIHSFSNISESLTVESCTLSNLALRFCCFICCVSFKFCGRH